MPRHCLWRATLSEGAFESELSAASSSSFSSSPSSATGPNNRRASTMVPLKYLLAFSTNSSLPPNFSAYPLSWPALYMTPLSAMVSSQSRCASLAAMPSYSIAPEAAIAKAPEPGVKSTMWVTLWCSMIFSQKEMGFTSWYENGWPVSSMSCCRRFLRNGGRKMQPQECPPWYRSSCVGAPLRSAW